MRGRVLRVLVEGASDETEYLSMGRHEGQAPEIDGQVYLSLPPEAVTPAPGSLGQRARHPLGRIRPGRRAGRLIRSLAPQAAAAVSVRIDG